MRRSDEQAWGVRGVSEKRPKPTEIALVFSYDRRTRAPIHSWPSYCHPSSASAAASADSSYAAIASSTSYLRRGWEWRVGERRRGVRRRVRGGGGGGAPLELLLVAVVMDGAEERRLALLGILRQPLAHRGVRHRAAVAVEVDREALPQQLVAVLTPPLGVVEGRHRLVHLEGRGGRRGPTGLGATPSRRTS